mmetsp:Transcript_4346/g.10625  ORF Transcript_4346/g.10625 Transcript_4346/m.10625 type:complete len:124 (+) Transcript_4346:312-683(+)
MTFLVPPGPCGSSSKTAACGSYGTDKTVVAGSGAPQAHAVRPTSARGEDLEAGLRIGVLESDRDRRDYDFDYVALASEDQEGDQSISISRSSPRPPPLKWYSFRWRFLCEDTEADATLVEESW